VAAELVGVAATWGEAADWSCGRCAMTNPATPTTMTAVAMVLNSIMVSIPLSLVVDWF